MIFPFRLAAALLAGCPFVAWAQAAPAPRAAGMTLDQYLQAGRSRISDRDADGDGRISRDEYAAAAGRRAMPSPAAGRSPTPSADAPSPVADAAAPRGAGAERMFDRFDANHDGTLDKGEIDAMLTARFQRLDANGDGILTPEERQAPRLARGGGMPQDR